MREKTTDLTVSSIARYFIFLFSSTRRVKSAEANGEIADMSLENDTFFDKVNILSFSPNPPGISGSHLG